MLATRPLLAASLVIPGILVLGYLWQKRRSEEAEQSSNSDYVKVSATVTSPASTVIDSKQVSLKLESLNRSRLDCIEEEEKSEGSGEVTECSSEIRSEGEKVTENPVKDPADSFDTVEDKVQVIVAEKVETADNTIVESSSEVYLNTPVEVDSEVTTTEINSEPKNSEENSVEMTTEESTETNANGESIPDVLTALKDPIASSVSSSLSDKLSDSLTSPIKSEASQKSESWSDLIDDEELELADCNQNVNMTNSFKVSSQDENGRHDSGVASPTEDFSRPDTVATESGTTEDKARISSGEDAGIGGSETGDVSDGNTDLSDDAQFFSYHFYIQDYLTGSFIGAKGASIKELKTSCNCNVIVRDDSSVSYTKRGKLKSRDRRYGDGYLNLVILEGTRANIDKCLDTIRERFKKHPELTLEQINRPDRRNLALNAGSVALSLVEGIMHDVVVSSIVYGDHIFLQQPTNPTFSALERLDSCMYNTYSQLTCPGLQRPINTNSICVAPSNGGWFRCQIVSYDDSEDSCCVKYVDYGGYEHVPADKLKQIRTDFLSLPFQAIECRLANIVVPEENSMSTAVLDELVNGQVIQARMLGVDEDNTPMVHIYRNYNGQTIMVNRELVDRNCAQWIESKLVALTDDSSVHHWNIFGDFSPSNENFEYRMMQVKYFENLPCNYTMFPDHPNFAREEEDVFLPSISCESKTFQQFGPSQFPAPSEAPQFCHNLSPQPFVSPCVSSAPYSYSLLTPTELPLSPYEFPARESPAGRCPLPDLIPSPVHRCASDQEAGHLDLIS